MGNPVSGPAHGSLDQSERRAALERILNSGIFDRAPNLEHILRYVCEKHLEGRVDEIKEYNIAVDALSRPADFDQKKDSIVRVEAHRLRKRLAEYYAGRGAADPLQIQIPAGTYVPHFIAHTPLTQPAEVEPTGPFAPPAGEPPTAVAPPSSPRPWRLFAVLLGLVLMGGAALIYRSQKVPEADQVRTGAAPEAMPAAPGDEVRILAGSTRDRIADHLGNVWLSDRYVSGGEVRQSTPRPIGRTLDSSYYLTRREGEFQYEVPVKPGLYEVRLHFAETVFGDGNVAGGGESSRVFALYVNHQERPQVIDVLSNAGGPNTAWIHVLSGVKPEADGKIHLRFAPFVKEQPFVNGIEIVPGAPQGIQPIRVVARNAPFTDSKHQLWQPDQFFEGGMYVQRHEPVTGTADIELFQGERYGNFNYAIPVDAKSHYTVTLRFAESWFGPGRPGGGGAGSRVFDVYCAGRTLLRRFDIYKEAGGALRAVVKTFRGLEPNAQGRLVLQFVPVENYALINSIEIVDEGK